MRRTSIGGSILAALIALLGATGVIGAAEDLSAARPQVVGEWVGTWGLYTPPRTGAASTPASRGYPAGHPAKDMRLDCRVVALTAGGWQATFEGECGRPYKYTIEMRGRQAGKVVLFQGTADLGEKDGGVFDWIGRATDDEFVGFYTSQKYTGHFRLARKAAEPAR